MPVNEPSVSKDHRAAPRGAPSLARSSRSYPVASQGGTPACQSGQTSPMQHGSTIPLCEPDHHHGCCNHPPLVPHQWYPPPPPSSQATLVSTPIPISVPMPMPCGGTGPSAPIVINAPAAPPAPPPPPPPPPPPEPRPSAAQEVASMMMLTMVDYLRRRMDKQLAHMYPEERRESSSKPAMKSPLHISDMGLSSLPRSPMTPIQTPETSPGMSPIPEDGKEKEKKKHKKVEEKKEGGDDNADQRKAPRPAISAKGADVVKQLDDLVSEGPGDTEILEEEEVGSPSKGETTGSGLCCCLVLWCTLLVGAFALAAAYLLFPDAVGDILCSLGIAKLPGLHDPDAIDHLNDTNSTLFVVAPMLPELGRSIFDVIHASDDSPITESPQEDLRILDEEYDGAGNTSSPRPNFAVTPAGTPLTSAVSLPSPNPTSAPYFSLNSSEDSGGGDDVFDEEPSGDMIDFGSFIDIAAFGRLLGRTGMPVGPSRYGYTTERTRSTLNSTSSEIGFNTTIRSGIQDLLDRLRLAPAGSDAGTKIPHDWLAEELVDSGPAVAVELDDEGEEWPIAGHKPGSPMTTDEYRGSVTLERFRIPSVTNLDGQLSGGRQAYRAYKRAKSNEAE